MGMSFVNTTKQWFQDRALRSFFQTAPTVCTRQTVCVLTGMTRTIASIVWTSIHSQFISPVKLCGSQDQKLYAFLIALPHSQGLCQSPSPTYAPCGSVCLANVFSNDTQLTVMKHVVRYEIQSALVIYQNRGPWVLCTPCVIWFPVSGMLCSACHWQYVWAVCLFVVCLGCH